MQAGDRTRESASIATAIAGPGPTGREIERGVERRSQVAQLLAAGRSAVDRALSENSDAFLRQVRQQGGQ